MRNEIMTPDHPSWSEFYNRLVDECDFKQDELGKTIWDCNNDLSKSEAILFSMSSINVDKSLAYFKSHGGQCDCKVLFRIDGAPV